MKNIEMLCWGMKHIASNHGMTAVTEWERDGEVCMMGGRGMTVPVTADVIMLCEDLRIPRHCVDIGTVGVDIWIPSREWCNEEYLGGLEMWRRR